MNTTTDMRTPIQKAAGLFGLIFALVGILGFVPGITTDYDRLGEFDQPGAKLLGIFAVNWLHNLVHIGFGLVGLAMARRPATARQFLIGGGLIYAVLFIYGLIIDKTSPANFVALNTADNLLHLVLSLGMIGAGLALGKRAMTDTSARRHRTAA